MSKRIKKASSPLPDDLLLSCLARISRLYYPTLSLVSKKFRSLLASPELYKARSLLGHTEGCLYVFLNFYPDPIPRLFTLCLKPNRTLTNDTDKKNKKSSGYILIPISSPHSAKMDTSGIVAVGSDIYEIGGLINDKPSSKVSVLDCRSHTWHEASNIHVARPQVNANDVDGKIYVVGGCRDVNSLNSMEVFDPNAQAWQNTLIPCAEMCHSDIISSIKIDGTIYMYNWDNGVAYKPKEDGTILRILKGLKGMPKVPCSDNKVKLVDCGGKMMILWHKYVPFNDPKTLWCAEISLERSNSEVIVGNVEWFGVVLEVPMFSEVSSVHAVIV